MRVVVADSSLLMRAGVRQLVEAAGMEVVGEAGDAPELLRKIRGHRPDVVVLDAGMAHAIRDEDVGLVLLSEHADARHLAELRTGGIGYLVRARITQPRRLIDAIRTVARGDVVLDPDVVGPLLERRHRGHPFRSLTNREREVLEAMAAGASNRGIARALFVSERAVERHITAIFAKLDVRAREDAHRRVLAVLAFLQA